MQKIILVAATNFEILKTLQFLESNFKQKSFSEFEGNHITVRPFVTGVGIMVSSFALGRMHTIKDHDLLIHAGISGAIANSSLILTEVVEVIEEQMIDFGAEEKDGSTIDLFDLDLLNKNQLPFSNKKIINTSKSNLDLGLKKTQGYTVPKASGSIANIHRISSITDGSIESLEGVSIFYACRVMDIPFVSIRSISNYITERNREAWQIQGALETLNNKLIQTIQTLDKP